MGFASTPVALLAVIAVLGGAARRSATALRTTYVPLTTRGLSSPPFAALCASRLVGNAARIETVAEERGLGIVAARRIERGEDVVRVPINATVRLASMRVRLDAAGWVTVENTRTRAELVSADGEEARLAAFLALAAERDANPDDGDDILTYARDLRATVRTPEWHEFANDRILDGVYELVPGLVDRIRGYRALEDAVASSLAPWASRERAREALYAVTSRAFALRARPELARETMMVPCADLFNHRSEGAGATFLVERDDVVVRITRAHAKGEEIFIDYGAKSNEDLLVQYGFVTRGNPHAVVGLEVDMDHPAVSTGRHDAAVKRAMASSLLSSSRRLTLGRNGLTMRDRPFGSLQLLRALTLRPEHLSALTLANVLGRDAPSPHESEARATELLVHLLLRALTAYHRALELDEDFSRDLRAVGPLAELLEDNTQILARAWRSLVPKS